MRDVGSPTTRVVGMCCHHFVDIFKAVFRNQDVAQKTNKVAVTGQQPPFPLVLPTPSV